MRERGLLRRLTNVSFGLPKLLIQDGYRRQLLTKCTDPTVKMFWDEEFAGGWFALLAEAAQELLGAAAPGVALDARHVPVDLRPAGGLQGEGRVAERRAADNDRFHSSSSSRTNARTISAARIPKISLRVCICVSPKRPPGTKPGDKLLES